MAQRGSKNSNDGFQDFDDPVLGPGDHANLDPGLMLNLDDYWNNEIANQLGAGDESLFRSPSDVLGYGSAIDPSLAPATSGTGGRSPFRSPPRVQDHGGAIESSLAPGTSAAPPLPQLTLPELEIDPQLHGPAASQGSEVIKDTIVVGSVSAPPEQHAGPNAHQSYQNRPAKNEQPVNPLPDVANQTVIGQGTYVNNPYGGQFGMYPNFGLMQQQHQQPQLFAPALNYPLPGYYNVSPGAGAHIPYQPPPLPANVDPSPAPQPSRQPAVAEGARISHKRDGKGDPNNDPKLFYSLPARLAPWGPLTGSERKRRRLFEYYFSTAELKPGLTFTKDQLTQFFLGNGHPNPRRNLTLWIQNTAAQANDRYAAGTSSSKCRFKGCPAGQNTILKGFYRVAFDEFSDLTGKRLDPFHNAGYMHLHCFETNFDLGYLIHYGARRNGFKIKADVRNFDFESRNPASINRDHRDMIGAYNDWVKAQKARADALEAQNAGKPPEQRYEGFGNAVVLPHQERLGSCLTEKHLNLETKGRARTREKRGGVHIGLHRGDLDKYKQLRAEMSSKKRRRADDDEGEDEDDKNDPEEAVEQPEGSGSKRPRRSSGGPARKKRKQSADSNGSSAAGTAGASTTRSGKRRRQDDDNGDHKDEVKLDDLWMHQGYSEPAAEAAAAARRSSRRKTSGAAGPSSQQGQEKERRPSDEYLNGENIYYASPRLRPRPNPATTNNPPVLRDDRLPERIGRLGRRQRREVEEAVVRQEKGLDKRKVQSV